MSEFSELSKLETLFVWQSSIENLEGGDNLYSVKRLSLYGDRKLSSLKGIEKFKNLIFPNAFFINMLNFTSIYFLNFSVKNT